MAPGGQSGMLVLLSATAAAAVAYSRLMGYISIGHAQHTCDSYRQRQCSEEEAVGAALCQAKQYTKTIDLFMQVSSYNHSLQDSVYHVPDAGSLLMVLCCVVFCCCSG